MHSVFGNARILEYHVGAVGAGNSHSLRIATPSELSRCNGLCFPAGAGPERRTENKAGRTVNSPGGFRRGLLMETPYQNSDHTSASPAQRTRRKYLSEVVCRYLATPACSAAS